MVDDPSEYVDTLLGDPAKKRAAEREVRKQADAWSERAAKYDEARRQSDHSVPAPGAKPTLQECAADLERERLFRLIEELVQWENTTNEEVLERARAEIWQSWRRACAENVDHPRAKELFDRHKLPAFHDPFAGGGSLPLEAQRLGLEAHASDLNPVAVLICKAMIEIPPKFAGKPPVNPEARNNKELFTKTWRGGQGLAEDVRYYGKWMRDEAEKRIGHLYPKIEITSEMAKERPDLKPLVGRKLTVIAWLWARTVKSPNPAFAHVDVPLASTFMLSTKDRKQAYVAPVIYDGSYRFAVNVGKPKDADAARSGTKLSRGANFRCLMSGTPIAPDYIKAEGTAGRMGARLMAIVAEGDRGRAYLPPSEFMEIIADTAVSEWEPVGAMVKDARAFTPTLYGITEWSDLFTDRQRVALATFSDLVQEARACVELDSVTANWPSNSLGLEEGGTGAEAYADAIATYLGLVVSRLVDLNNALCQWRNDPAKQHVGHLFARQAIPMVWDFAEANPLGSSAGGFDKTFLFVPKIFPFLCEMANEISQQADAATQSVTMNKVVSTDPPYYDNVPYADLSDFFYVWLRRSLKSIIPQLFTTLAVPKTEELVATTYRHNGRAGAELFFLSGMTKAMHRLAKQAHPAFPVTIYYAFKQSETDGGERSASTGWETFLETVISAGFSTTGTWPMRTELGNRMRGMDSKPQ